MVGKNPVPIQVTEADFEDKSPKELKNYSPQTLIS